MTRTLREHQVYGLQAVQALRRGSLSSSDVSGNLDEASDAIIALSDALWAQQEALRALIAAHRGASLPIDGPIMRALKPAEDLLAKHGSAP